MKTLLIVIFLSTTTIARAQTNQVALKNAEFIKAVLDEQNSYRKELGLPLLTWSPQLARDALAWARKLASSGKGAHDPQAKTLHEGENIWWGTVDAYSYSQMVDFWASEKKDFVYGIFPNCANARSAVVGHYTQMVWKNTTSTGCALSSNGKMDFLVCRYAPPGNVIGQKPY
jgi:uncharacterized protein YkwD